MATRESAVHKALESRYSTLTSQQKRAADYMLANQGSSFAMSVQELARAAKVSEATLVRFARRLGFEGYLELRSALVGEARRDLLPEDRFEVEEKSARPAGTLARVARREVENVNRTLEGLDAKQLRKVVVALRRAEQVATLGSGVSALLARFAAYSLFQIGLRAEALLRDTLPLVEQVDRLSKRTALLAFAFPPYSKDTVTALGRARDRRLSVLLITDGPRSPAIPLASATLFARTDNILYTNSISGPVVLINALATEVALGDKARALGSVRGRSDVTRDEYV